MIYDKVLMIDSLDIQTPRYDNDFDAPMLFHTGGENSKQLAGEVIVPCFKRRRQDWDEIMIKLLGRCKKSVLHVDKLDSNLYDIAHELFYTHTGDPKIQNVVAHHDADVQELEFPPFEIFTTKHCPKDVLFLLPPPGYTGVVPVKTLDNKQGMAVVNSSLIVKIHCRRASLIDAMLML